MKRLFTNAKTWENKIVNILVENGRIISIGKEFPEAESHEDLNRLLVLPGMIDPHVHVRDMRLSHKETWETASLAALSGGITTIFDMPNTDPPTIDAEGLSEKRKFASKSHANYGFHFGANKNNFKEIKNAENIAGLKIFLAHSSSAFEIPDEDEIRSFFELGAQLNIPVLVHSECQACVDDHSKEHEHVITNHNRIRDPICAYRSTEMILRLAEEVGNVLYIAHVSTAPELDLVRKAKDKGVKVFVEATPHHLLLNEDVLLDAGHYGKVNPPIRSEADRKALWEALLDGTVDTLGTDHAPHTVAEKDFHYDKAPSGFPGLETAVPMLLTEVLKGLLPMKRFLEVTVLNPARIFSVQNRGDMVPGNWADFYVVDDKKNALIDPDLFQSKAKYSPFRGLPVSCNIESTIVNGNLAYHNTEFSNETGQEVDYS